MLQIMLAGHSSKKKELIIGSKGIDMIDNSDTYDKYKDLCLSKKERKEKLLQGIQLVNGLKERVSAKKVDGMTLTVATQENAIKNMLDKIFTIPCDFDFFILSVYPYGLKECLFIRLELNSAANVLLCTVDTNAIYKISDIFLEYDAIFDDPYATSIGKMYIGPMSIPYTKVTLIHYESLKKKTLSGRLT